MAKHGSRAPHVLLKVLLMVVACPTLLSCYAKIHYAPDISAFETCRPATGERVPETIVGVGLSGGGSRSAVFAAAALEALWEHGLFADLSHVSGVSGGSIAASYLAAKQPSCQQPTLDERNACWREFFDQYDEAMRFNYWSAMKKRQLLRGRFLSNTRFATSLADVLDRRFLQKQTFGDLKALQSADTERPVLLVNAASYDEHRRFVFTNHCLPTEVSEPSDSESWPTNRYNPLSARGLRSATFSQPGCERAAPGDLPLSLAVASSAAFPPIVGPVTLKVPTGCADGPAEYLHLTDGGVFDNSGIDVLEEIVLQERASKDSRLRRVLLIALDAGFFEPRESKTEIANFWLLSHPSSLNAIPQLRGQEYHDLVWDRVAGQLREEGVSFEMLTMRHVDAELDHWPDSCSEEREPGTEETRDRIRARLQSIETAFNIKTCDADLLQMAAHAIVHASLDAERVEYLRNQGFAINAAED